MRAIPVEVRGIRPPCVKLQAVVSCLIRVLGTNLGPLKEQGTPLNTAPPF